MEEIMRAQEQQIRGDLAEARLRLKMWQQRIDELEDRLKFYDTKGAD